MFLIKRNITPIIAQNYKKIIIVRLKKSNNFQTITFFGLLSIVVFVLCEILGLIAEMITLTIFLVSLIILLINEIISAICKTLFSTT